MVILKTRERDDLLVPLPNFLRRKKPKLWTDKEYQDFVLYMKKRQDGEYIENFYPGSNKNMIFVQEQLFEQAREDKGAVKMISNVMDNRIYDPLKKPAAKFLAEGGDLSLLVRHTKKNSDNSFMDLFDGKNNAKLIQVEYPLDTFGFMLFGNRGVWAHNEYKSRSSFNNKFGVKMFNMMYLSLLERNKKVA